MGVRTWGARVVAFVLLAATPAFSQEASTIEARDRETRLRGKDEVQRDLDRAQLRLGAFYLYSTFEIGELGYDENLYAPTEEERDDFTISLSAPQRLYFVPSRKFVLSADVRPGYVWYRKAEDARHWNLRYRGDMHLLFNRMYSDFYYEKADERRRDLSELNFLVDLDSQQIGNDTEIAISSRSNIVTGVFFREIEYPNAEGTAFDFEEVSRLNRDEARYSAAFRHKTFPLTSTEIGAARETYDFQDNRRDGDRDQAWVGATRRTGRSTLRAQIGAARLDYIDPSEKDYSGPLGFVSYEFSPRRRWVGTITGRRDLVFSVYAENQHFAADRLSATFTLPATRWLDLRFVGEAGKNSYFVPTFDEIDRINKEREDDILYGSVGFTTRLNRLAVGLDVGRFERKSNFMRFDEDGIRLVLRLSLTP
jgi:hypothetical protein